MEKSKAQKWWLAALFLPVAAAWSLQPNSFDSMSMVKDISRSRSVLEQHKRVLEAAERIGDGILTGPEDLAHNAQASALFTGCADGWIKKISLCGREATVNNWSFTGGRPIGLAFGRDGQLYVTDAYKGLLRISLEGEMEVLAQEAGGLKFGMPDGIDVAGDGMVYFTDATYKHNLSNYKLELREGRPHGRFLRYDPSTKHTTVLLHGLYFANGVAVSPKQDFVVYCESMLARCKKYHIKGKKKGIAEKFVDLPGYPDDIRYDGNGIFWIALAAGKEPKLPVESSGVLAVNVHGKSLALYTDNSLNISVGTKIGKFLYFGSLVNSFIIQLDLAKLSAISTKFT